jgi:hypothetical protein
MPSLWIDALKQFNNEKGAWCIPRKGSEDYDKVRALMGHMKDAKNKPVKAESAKKVEIVEKHEDIAKKEIARLEESSRKAFAEKLEIPKEALERALKMSKQNAGIRKELHKETHKKDDFIKELSRDSRVKPDYMKTRKLEIMFEYLPEEFLESDLKKADSPKKAAYKPAPALGSEEWKKLALEHPYLKGKGAEAKKLVNQIIKASESSK